MHGLILTVTGIIVAVIGSVVQYCGLDFLGLTIAVLGGMIGVWGAIRQYLESQPFVWEFSANDWHQCSKGEYEILIPPSRHRRGKSAVAAVEILKADNTFEPVFCDLRTREDGTYRIAIAVEPIAGRVIMK